VQSIHVYILFGSLAELAWTSARTFNGFSPKRKQQKIVQYAIGITVRINSKSKVVLCNSFYIRNKTMDQDACTIQLI